MEIASKIITMLTIIIVIIITVIIMMIIAVAIIVIVVVEHPVRTVATAYVQAVLTPYSLQLKWQQVA